MDPCNNLVVVSDLHCGCRLGLCHPEGLRLDDGGIYLPSDFQRKIWNWWEEFWCDWLPKATQGEPYDVVINGDTIDGNHHGSTTQISHNLEDQERLALKVLEPIAIGARRLFFVRGTEAHVGPSAVQEESVAHRLGAVPNSSGQFARHELLIRVGNGLVDCKHHIGTSGSAAYESTAVHKELIEVITESAKQGAECPTVLVRSHRHRAFQTSFSGPDGDFISVVTPGWQGRTPFVFKIAGGRNSLPQFGGILVRAGKEERMYVRHFTKHFKREEPV